jgi:hypothetical protein
MFDRSVYPKNLMQMFDYLLVQWYFKKRAVIAIRGRTHLLYRLLQPQRCAHHHQHRQHCTCTSLGHCFTLDLKRECVMYRAGSKGYNFTNYSTWYMG